MFEESVTNSCTRECTEICHLQYTIEILSLLEYIWKCLRKRQQV